MPPRSRRLSRPVRLGLMLIVFASLLALFYGMVGRYAVERFGLRAAVETDNIALARLCLALGAPLNPHSPCYGSSLHEAAGQNHLAMTAFLMQAGADPDLRDGNGETALGVAVRDKGTLPIVELLLQHEADPNAPGRCGTLPLDHADQRGDKAIIERLERAGARRAHIYGCG